LIAAQLKVQFFLAASRTDRAEAPVAGQLADLGRRVRLAHRQLPRIRCAIPREPQVSGGSAHSAVADHAAPKVDALLDIWVGDAAQFESVGAVVAGDRSEQGGWIDAKRSSALAGSEYDIMPGIAPELIVFALRRLATLTRQEFQNYWLNVHADFGRRISGNRYRQFHADPHATRQVARRAHMQAADFDGVAEAYFADITALNAMLASPQVAEAALADEKRFIDHSRSVFGIYQTIAEDSA
jgi:hypothetical protein